MYDHILEELKGALNEIKDSQERIVHNPDKQIFEVGNWVQVFTGDRQPVYAKVREFNGEHVVLYGIANFGDDGKPEPIALPKEQCLGVSPEVEFCLEFANKNNYQLKAGVQP